MSRRKRNNLEKHQGYIYQITNKINGKSYIGKTIADIEKYIGCHFEAKDKNKVLHKAIRKNGKENFTWKILWEGVCNNHHLNNLEIFFIAYYDTFEGIGYNCSKGGDGGKTDISNRKITYGQDHPCSKTNMSKERRKEKAIKGVETKRRTGSINGWKLSKEEKLRRSILMTGKKKSKEHIKNISKSLKGKKLSEKTKKNMSIKRQIRLVLLHDIGF